MNEETVKIPHERVGVIIGKQGETRQAIEKKGKVTLEVDSKSGEVAIEGNDALLFLKTLSVVKAIGRGFSPEKAFKLFEDEFMLDILELTEISESKKEQENFRARVIGTHGKAREKIERETHSFLSVFGKTVSIIAKIEDLPAARKAVEMLLKGASHSKVYSILKKMESTKFELI